jgi:hypothetical protein
LSKKDIKYFHANLDSGEDIINFSITTDEFGPADSCVKGTFYGKLLDEDGILHNILVGEFQLIRVDMN